ncbi:MAG: FMN-binding glutamate synthase family protein [Proteobacteria bacterium]|nr:FMN-binding glutamate synthase family protein [Pseudomonadota bacterium]
MNLQRPNASDATQTTNRSRSVAPNSGLCSRCVDGCTGNCEVFKATFRGRELLYPGPFGTVIAGADKEYPVDYSHLNIQGYAIGAKGLADPSPETALFPVVDTETSFGYNSKVKLKLPVFTGALGSTDIAKKNWDHFAVGAAISGVSLICGENVCGIDPGLKTKNGKVVKSPDMEYRVKIYRQWQEGYGDIHVQMNVEDTKLGVAEYVIDKLGVTTMELKWGQGAKCIGGEIKVDSLERAIELKKRGYIVTPDPTLKECQEAFKAGAIREFERHSRLGFVTEEDFLNEVERLRNLGAERVTLKTGAYSAIELALAIKLSSMARIDLLTIDGAGGGTGMSPWRMMEEWGIPTFYLQSLTHEFCQKLAANGEWVPDIAIAGGFSTEDHIFKVLAMGAPYVKAVCMGRALMIPGMVGKNIGVWLKDKSLPKTVSQFGSKPEEIFVTWEELRGKYGNDFKKIPLGAVGIYTFAEKLKVGLQQLMAGSRNFNISTMGRRDLMSLTEEATKVSGIPYVMDAYKEEAEKIINS